MPFSSGSLWPFIIANSGQASSLYRCVRYSLLAYVGHKLSLGLEVRKVPPLLALDVRDGAFLRREDVAYSPSGPPESRNVLVMGVICGAFSRSQVTESVTA